MDLFIVTTMKPLSLQLEFGLLPLVVVTLSSSLIALIVAAPIGLMSAIFLSEYASDKLRKVIKPLLEILAGIPTIVYGFFALTFVTPLLKMIIPGLEIGRAHV